MRSLVASLVVVAACAGAGDVVVDETEHTEVAVERATGVIKSVLVEID